jgi:malonyl CoA-acyl carrier protein transacylase
MGRSRYGVDEIRATEVTRQTSVDSGYVKKASRVNEKFVKQCVISGKNRSFSAATKLCSHLSGA